MLNKSCRKKRNLLCKKLAKKINQIKMKKICVLFSIMTIATASLNTETDNLLSTALKFVRDCGDKSMLLCAKVSTFFL